MSVRSASARLLLAASLLGGLAACSSDADATPPAPLAPTTSTTTVARPTEDVDRLLPVGPQGERMHLVCSGSGERTVLLIAGFTGAGSESWTEVMPELADETRVCTADRLGLGTSDAPSTVQTFATQTADLTAALHEAGEHGPYLVAGHSFGGAGAVTFAAEHPDEVDGLVLVDASPTDWPEAACAAPGEGFAQTCAMFDPTGNPEHLDARAAFAEVASVDSLGDLPVRILTRADVAELADTWQAGQERWASLSSDAEIIPVADTGHVIQDEQPAAVLEQIRSLL